MSGPDTVIPVLVLIGASLAILALCAALVEARTALQRASMSARAAREEAFYKSSMMDSSHDGLVIQSLDGSILWANVAYLKMFGYDLKDILGRNPLEYCVPEPDRPSPAAIAAFRYVPDPEASTGTDGPLREGAGVHLHRNIRRNGEEFWNQVSVSFLESPSHEMHVILVCRDVTEQVDREQKLRLASERLAFAATHDELTGLANRSHLIDFVEKLRSGEGGSASFGLIHLDVDRFKRMNDSHGHVAGDALLQHLSKLLTKIAGPQNLVARHGGDEFVIVVPNVGGDAELVALCEELRRGARTPFAWSDKTISCSISIGAARSNPSDTNVDMVLLRADYALYSAKKGGRGRVGLYDARMQAQHERAMSLGRGLRDEIADGGLTFQYQPIIEPYSGQISGFETLVRWRHPTEGLLYPPDFLELAAEYGLMVQLDYAAMQAALDLLKHLEESGHPNMRNGFNASQEILAAPDFPDRLIAETAKRGLDPSQVVLEVLETVVVGRDGAADRPLMRALLRLHEAGFIVSLDDFGTGYAGLTHLARLPLSGIKIDKSLVMQALHDPTSKKITAAIGDLSCDLELKLVGEGVEDRETARWLTAIGCTRLQGFWLSRAIDFDAVLPFLESHDPAAFAITDTEPRRRPDPVGRQQLQAPPTAAMR